MSGLPQNEAPEDAGAGLHPEKHEHLTPGRLMVLGGDELSESTTQGVSGSAQQTAEGSLWTTFHTHDTTKFSRIVFTTRDGERQTRFRTFINLTNALLGAGVIVVSATYETAGLGPGTLLLLFSCFLCYVSGSILISLQLDLRAETHEEMAFEMFGPVMRVIVSIIKIIFTVCFTSSYLVIGVDQIESWLRNFDFALVKSGHWIALLCGYTLLPVALTIPRSITLLKQFQIVTVGLIILYAVSITIRAFNEPIPVAGVTGFRVSMSLFTAFGADLMTFSLPVIMMPVIYGYRPDMVKRQTIMGSSLVFCFVVIAVPGIMGYLLKGEKTESDILNSFPDDDALMVIVRIAMFCVATFSYPMLNADIVGSIGAICFNNGVPEYMTLKQRAIIIPLVNLVSFLGAVVSVDIQPIIAIGGSLGVCFIGMVFPAMYKLRLGKTRKRIWKVIFYVLFAIFGCVAGVICTYTSIRDLIVSYSANSQ